MPCTVQERELIFLRRSLFVVLTKGKSKLAFTLVELVVTIAIIGVLAGYSIPFDFWLHQNGQNGRAQ